MKILVIDDSLSHQKSARQTLKGHDLTVVGGHDEALNLLSTNAAKPYWDAVLSDLLMPAGRQAQGGPGLKYVGQEMPVGWSLALQAAISGAKFVAVATDMNHHHHPASAMLDRLDRAPFTIAGARAVFTNHVRMVGLEESDVGTCEKCDGSGKQTWNKGTPHEQSSNCYDCGGTGRHCTEKGKDWGEILSRLMAEEKTAEV